MINLAVIGLRNIGKGHVRRAQELEGVTFLAGADTDEARGAAAKDELGFEYVCTDMDRILEDPRIDGVVLALPNQLHAPFSVRALEAGKHVLVEKPITGDSSEVSSMIEARDKSGKVLMVGMNQRFSPLRYAQRELLRQKTIGDVYFSKTHWTQRFVGTGLAARGAWGFQKETAGGGPLLDLGIHKLDLLLFMLDFPEVESVMGYTSEGIGCVEFEKLGIDYELEDFGMGMIRLKNGGCIHLEASYFHNQDKMNVQEFMLSGTKGVINDTEVAIITSGESQAMSYEPMETAPKTCVDHFCRVLRGEEELSSTCEQALTGLKIIEAIYQSADTGELIRF